MLVADDDEKNSVNGSSNNNIKDNESILSYRFIRKRSQGSMHSYGLTSVYIQPEGEKLERKQIIQVASTSSSSSSSSSYIHVLFYF